MSSLFDPGSFRDPDGRLFHHNGAVCRTVVAARQTEIAQLLQSSGFQELMTSGLVLPTEMLDAPALGLDPALYGARILRQKRIPFVSYPGEWSFSMMRKAALTTLEITKKALSWGYILKDATPFNIVFEGAHPRFVDILSFVPHKAGAPWHSYGQFCRAFLYPLLIASYRQIDVRPWLLAQSSELSPAEAKRFFSTRDLTRPGVFKDVYLAAKLETMSTAHSAASVRRQAKFPLELITANISRLEAIIKGLASPYVNGTEWSQYANNTSYSEDGVAEKKAVVESVLSKTKPTSVLDIGANTGVYSRIAAKHTSGPVLSLDGDLGAVDALFNSLGREETLYPIVANLAHPTPATGWSLKERPSLLDRVKCDFFMALAVIHHLRISANVGFAQIVEQLAEIAPAGIIEWVEPEDDMVKTLVALRDCQYPDFNYETFTKIVEERFRIVSSTPLKGGMRRLMHVERLAR